MASYEQRGDSVRAIVRVPGGGKKSATFDTLAEAEAWGARMEAKKSVGALKGGEAARLTVGELFDAFDDAVASKTDSAKFNRLRLAKWQHDELASKRVIEVTTHDINEWIERNLERPSKRTGRALLPATVNRELNLMSSAWNYAVKDRRWIETNPCHGARRPEQGRPRKRPLLTSKEIAAIRVASGYDSDPELRTLTSRVGACVLLALETGMRSGEILRIRPIDYWRDKCTLHVAAIEQGGRKGARSGRATTDPSRNVPLTAHAMEILDRLMLRIPAGQDVGPGFTRPPYIVGADDKQRDALWRKIRDRAGVHDLHFHDCKHEAATRLAGFLDVLALSHAIGTKDVRLLRDTYYNNDASRSAALLPASLTPAMLEP